MDKNTREFICNELFMDGFIEQKPGQIVLEETEETGRSELYVQLKSEENLCIANIDKKEPIFCSGEKKNQ